MLLRPLDPDRDGPALHAIFGDEESCRYLPSPAFESVEKTIAQLRSWTIGFEDTSWAIVDGGEEALGRITFFNSDGGDVWETGCMVAPAARGRALSERALRETIPFMFEVKAARRLFADIDPENAPSLRIFEKLGFQREGVLRAHWKTHIGERDSVIMSLLNRDPRPGY